jgi:DNA-binding NtrC family response regulator
MRKGAYDYLAKPFEKDELLVTLAQAAEKIRLRRENRELRGMVAERYGFGRMVGRSPAMQAVYRLIEKVAAGSSTVLIRGESGTGKELVARAIHASGPRSAKPFVAINCAAIPESLIESDLFGHERGAFTGALAAKAGRFEEVEDGTLFLDEVGSMEYELQAKLLRVIQEREFQRIGSSRMLRFRGRLVAATSQDLEALMAERRFREDLYFRLNVVPIELPPLREREGDIALLACGFLEKYARDLSKRVRTFSPRALDLLEAYSWPGNVRELENAVERMTVLADESCEVLDESLLPGNIQAAVVERSTRGGTAADEEPEAALHEAPEAAPRAPRVEAPAAADRLRLPAGGVRLEDVERQLIADALERSGGRLEPAARLLGITYKTLQYRIKKYGLQKQGFQAHGRWDGSIPTSPQR